MFLVQLFRIPIKLVQYEKFILYSKIYLCKLKLRQKCILSASIFCSFFSYITWHKRVKYEI